MTKNRGKIRKTKGFGSMNDGEDCSRNPCRKVAGYLDCDLQSLYDSIMAFS